MLYFPFKIIQIIGLPSDKYSNKEYVYNYAVSLPLPSTGLPMIRRFHSVQFAGKTTGGNPGYLETVT